jgi:tetratricopeptide (TPR) repeat protein
MENGVIQLCIRITLLGIILFLLKLSPVDGRYSDATSTAYRLIHQGNPLEADAKLSEIQTFEPWQPLPWVELSDVYLNMEIVTRPISILQPLATQGLLDQKGLLTLALSLEKTDQIALLEDTLLAIVKMEESGSETVIACRMLVDLYRKEGRFDQALIFQTRLTEIAPGNMDFLIEKIVLELGLYPERSEIVKYDISKLPSWLVKSSNEVTKLRSIKDSAVYAANMGQIFGKIAVWDLAETWFSKAVHLSPDYAESWAFLAEARQQNGRDGSEQIKTALRLQPDSTGVRALGALYYRRQGDFAAAESLLKQNINDFPGEETWYLELGGLLAETGRMEEAVAIYQRAVEIDPENFRAYAAMARFSVIYNYELTEIGHPYAQKAIMLAAQEPEAHDVYGQVLLAEGEMEAADLAFSNAVTLDPDYAPSWLHIGQTALSNGDSAKAVESLLKVVSLAGNAREGQLASRLLNQYYGIFTGIQNEAQ